MLLLSRIGPVIIFAIIVAQCVHGYQRIVRIDEESSDSTTVMPTNLPTAPGPTTGLPGPIGPTTGLPGPIGPTTGLPGPIGPTTGLPGPIGPTTGLPGPIGPTTGLPGPIGPTTGLPGPVAPPTDPTTHERQSKCCYFGICTCFSFHRALINLTSNVLLNVTSDVMLTSVINVSSLENVSIIGHNNPTVKCRGAGGIHLFLCRNCIIQGITWDECGSDNDEPAPGLKLTYSFNITVRNCIFQHSRGQTVAISEILGYVNIDGCKFHNNDPYEGHGPILNIFTSSIGILQSSNGMNQILLKIQDCSFAYNKVTTSLVYVENRIPEHSCKNIMFLNTTFSHNLGVSIYAVNQKFNVNGNTLFQNNIAIDGTAIVISNHSAVIFGQM